MFPVLIKTARPATTADEDEQTPDEFVKKRREETVLWKGSVA